MSEALTCDKIFSTMPARFNAGAATGWTANVQFEISGDGGGEWTVAVDNGSCAVHVGKVGAPTATVKVDAATYVGIVSGTVDGQMAFLTGKIMADNLADLMRFQMAFRG
ncbi:MAG: SCP2 sterol-binding domain-containing protein [Candidatus Schekmanbacteria bacterium]|nr:SCP2 sterol-binding domain-containing protein [Candidatus Schekmanbacteria bacterium]